MDPTKTRKIGALRLKFVQKDFKNFLQQNIDVVVLSHENMLRINLSVIVHKLNINPSHHLVK